MMPLELYSTEHVYRLAHAVQPEAAAGSGGSGGPSLELGYYEVVLATALVALAAFLVDLVRKVVAPPRVGGDTSLPRGKAVAASPARSERSGGSILPDLLPVLGGGGAASAIQRTTRGRIEKFFPGAVVNQELVEHIKEALQPFGYGETSLIATSLCCDEVNRPLEKDLASMYDHYFAMGGLAGVPFGGVTAFGAMAQHIPDSGSCLIVYGPHVGIDSEGTIGTVNRRGKIVGGACCGSAVAAAAYVRGVLERGEPAAAAPDGAFDAQQ